MGQVGFWKTLTAVLLLGGIAPCHAQIEKTFILEGDFDATLDAGSTINIPLAAIPSTPLMPGFVVTTLTTTVNGLTTFGGNSDADNLKISLHYGTTVVDATDDPHEGMGGQPLGSAFLLLSDGNDNAVPDVNFTNQNIEFRDGEDPFAGTDPTPDDTNLRFAAEGGSLTDEFGTLPIEGPWFISITTADMADPISFEDVVVRLTAVPEPASMLLFGIGFASLTVRRRRRPALA